MRTAPRPRSAYAIVALVTLAALALEPQVGAQRPLFTVVFPPDEFAARREKVLAQIGDGIAVLQGAAEHPAYVRFRQNNQFFYLTGVEVPRALLLLDGRTKQATLFLQPRNERLEQSEGPVLVPDAEAARLTGIANVQPRDAFHDRLVAAVGPGRAVYTPMRAESLGAGTPQAAGAHAAATTADPWDGRPSREQAFQARLRAAAPGAEIRDLDPILDAMRMVKSPREIAVIREATRLAGVALMEGMRAARPGMREHELEAIGDWVFKRHGAQGFAYFALVAAGRNAHYPHYHGGSAELRDGELVLFDYAPDYRYYTSDVTRMLPANGRFSPAQRELYSSYVKLYMALMESIRPGAAPRDIIRAAVGRMDQILRATTFRDTRNRTAAEAFVDRYRTTTRNSLGHMVGMEVHDVVVPFDVLQPGMVFTIEPPITIPDERVYVRLEDVILVTPTGYESLSAFVPMDAEGIERLMAEPSRFDAPAPATFE
jgi:Xaa-Pro aminopeptidase